MKRRNIVLEQNQTMTSPDVFMEEYNKTIPAYFPRVSMDTLKQFQLAHPAFFKKGGEWSIEKHRKRLMDWLASRREA